MDLAVDHKGVSLTVRDDGKGLSRDALAQSSGGLDNATRRLHELGGSLTLVPVPNGSELIARVLTAR